MQNPKHILITGASSGIGAALAEHYAAPGIRLSLLGRNRERLASAAVIARKKGATVIEKEGDVVDAPSLAEWIQHCDAAEPLHLVIANAGISAGTGSGEETEQQARAIFAVNLEGVLNTIHPALALMLPRKQGQIAIVSSLAGFRGFAGAPAYCGSKAAVRVYGESLRGDVAPHGVEINVICPGFIKTPMTDVNKFPMPFMMTAERAAAIIATGLAKNHGRIAFPWPMYALVRLMATLPQSVIDLFAARLPKKSG